jgi:hypothetical protein
MNRPDNRPAVEELYRAFQNVRKPTGIDFCAPCHDPGEIADLLSKPLRDVSIESLTSCIYSAFNTGGAKEDYRYFLPRCLDLCCSSAYPQLDIALVLNKLPQAEWRTWPEQLQRGYLCNPFWDHANPNHERLVKWFQSAKVTAWINSIYKRRYS